MHSDQMKFQDFKSTKHYFDRMRQIKEFQPVARDILKALIEKGSITDNNLNGLIQLLRYRDDDSEGDRKSLDNAIIKYLPEMVINESIALSLGERLRHLSVFGFTQVGKAGIKNPLSAKHLDAVYQLLSGAFSVRDSDAGRVLVEGYLEQGVPEVTAGVYSPWLYYINPGIFPIVTKKSVALFAKTDSYSMHVVTAKDLLERYGESDLGVIDSFAREPHN